VVAEAAERGESLAETARRRDVHPQTLRWWRTRLRSANKRSAVTLLPVRVRPESASVRIVVGEIVLEVDAGATPDFVAALVQALRA